MTITEKDLKEIGNYYFNDLPFKEEETDMLMFLNMLPRDFILDGLKWGFNDSVVRNNIFELMCENQFNMSVEEYYESEIFKNRMKGICIKIDFEKMKKFEMY